LSEEEIIETLELFCQALENVASVLRQNLAKDINQMSNWNPNKIKRIPTEGTRGPYEKADPQATTDFKTMLANLKAHRGKLTRDGLFYWVFDDAATVGRKKR